MEQKQANSICTQTQIEMDRLREQEFQENLSTTRAIYMGNGGGEIAINRSEEQYYHESSARADGRLFFAALATCLSLFNPYMPPIAARFYDKMYDKIEKFFGK